jgi:proteasome lid subunit RPN8/RPN11
MYKIQKEVADSIIEAARNSYPDEFIAMLGGVRGEKVIDELIIVPAVYGEGFTMIYSHLVPFDVRMLGTVHSHPSPANYPSNQDLATFERMGEIHIIIGHPYTYETIRAFDRNGKDVKLAVV